jgi:hypothetical protein
MILLLVLPQVAGAAEVIEVPLTYREPGEGEFQPQGYKPVQMQPQMPAGDWTPPDGLTDRAMYAAIDLAGESRLLVVDMASPDDGFFTRLLFDTDGDGDLSNDPVIEADTRKMQNTTVAVFNNIKAMMVIEGTELSYRFGLQIQIRGQFTGTMPGSGQYRALNSLMMRQCSYFGELTLDGHTYSIALDDLNLNGRFDDFTKPPRSRGNGQNMNAKAPMRLLEDRIYVVEGEKMDRYDRLELGRYLSIGGNLFSLTIDPACAFLRLEPVTMPTATVQLNMPYKKMSLLSSTDEIFSCFHSGATMSLPPGEYKLISYKAVRADSEGDLWRVGGYGTMGMARYSVTADGGTITVGEPFKTTVTIQGQVRGAWGSRGVALLFSVKGNDGSMLDDLVHIEGTQSTIARSSKMGRDNYPKEPAFLIVKEDGEIIHQGSFEYG